MGGVEYQQSTHVIDDITLIFSKVTPTNALPVTRRIVIGDAEEPEQVALQFTQEGFDLLKAIISEY